MIKWITNQIPMACMVMLVLSFGCSSAKVSPSPVSEPKVKTLTPEEQKVKAVWDQTLVAVGNRNAKALKELSFEKARIGLTYRQDSVWEYKEVTMEDFLHQMISDKDQKPFLEYTQSFDVSIADDHLAMIRAETGIAQFGVPGIREVNYAILMKDKEQWKLFSIAWTMHRLPKEERKLDLNLFAQTYAQVWGSQRPEFVALFFEENGSLQINQGNTSTGRDAITRVAQSFMTQFPDMKVSFDSLAADGSGTRFYWTLTGTDASPGGKGNSVKISGYELWQMGKEGRIQISKGFYSAGELKKQLERSPKK